MKAITVNGTIKKYKIIPKKWRRLATPDKITVGYNYLTNEEHELDGFRYWFNTESTNNATSRSNGL